MMLDCTHRARGAAARRSRRNHDAIFGPASEALEPRRLLAVAVPLARINFQPESATAPAGYAVDSGAAFGDRANGAAYGWNAANHRAVERFQLVDQRLDTFNHMQRGGNFAWEIEVPNGQYLVRLAAGDPRSLNSRYRINVEDVLALTFNPSSARPVGVSVRKVDVADGRLTISNASGARDNKINYVDVFRYLEAAVAPANLTATAVSATRIDLAWGAASGAVDGYRIERSSDGVNYVSVAQLGAGATGHSDTGLTEGTVYHYRVSAYNAMGSSPGASASASTPLAAPTALQARALANVSRVELQWANNSAAATGVIIERSGPTGFSEIARLAAAATAYTDVTPSPATTYSYRVRAYNAAGTSAPTAPGSATTADFQVFQLTYYRDKPDLTGYGIQNLSIGANEFFWKWGTPGGGYDYNTPNEEGTRRMANAAAARGHILVIDIEHWPTDIRRAPIADVQASMQKLGQVVDWIRDAQPELKIGFYAIMPLRDYWTPVLYLQALDNPNDRWWQANLPTFEQNYRQWQAANDFLKPLADKVDYILPSLYPFYDNLVGWEYYARGNLMEAQRYGKLVMPFLTEEFHASTPLVGQELSPEYWRLQLEVSRQYADGLVIWGGVHYSAEGSPTYKTWDETDGWWAQTKEFLEAR